MNDRDPFVPYFVVLTFLAIFWIAFCVWALIQLIHIGWRAVS